MSSDRKGGDELTVVEMVIIKPKIVSFGYS